jgi:YggT family protein
MDIAQIIYFFSKFVVILGDFVIYAIIGRIIMSWLVVGGGRQPSGRIAQILFDITEPIIGIARKIPHKFGMIDFAPLIAILGVDFMVALILIILQNI